MKSIYINAVAITAPGLPDWPSSMPVLRGDQDYVPADVGKFTPAILRPNERRRTTPLIKLALQTAEQAMQQVEGNAAFAPNQVACVFASSDGDAEIIDSICSSLTLPDKPVSPTQFHNSVHNAPAGYWAIATQSHLPSSSISAGHYTFAVSLVEAACYTLTSEVPILLVAYDLPAPYPLDKLTGVTQIFALAFLISSQPNAASVCQCRLELTNNKVNPCINPCINPMLEPLRLSNPAARSLPLLELIAANETASIHLPYSEYQSLQVEVSPC